MTSRLKIIHVNEFQWIDLLQGKICLKTKLPDDVKFNRAFYEPGYCGLSVVIESDEFEEVREGDFIPMMKEIEWEKVEKFQWAELTFERGNAIGDLHLSRENFEKVCAKYGIKTKNGKIDHPLFGEINLEYIRDHCREILSAKIESLEELKKKQLQVSRIKTIEAGSLAYGTDQSEEKKKDSDNPYPVLREFLGTK